VSRVRIKGKAKIYNVNIKKMKIVSFLINLFRPSKKYYGIFPIKIYVLKIFFALMFFMAGKDAWTKLLQHEGIWDPEVAVAWCAITAYTTLSGIGIIRTLRMLPIMLFMFFYKGLWLIIVAYPLWVSNQLMGSVYEEWAFTFLILVIPFLFTPWGYVFNHYILGRKNPDFSEAENLNK
jgi:sensor histidine kinase YesM